MMWIFRDVYKEGRRREGQDMCENEHNENGYSVVPLGTLLASESGAFGVWVVL